MLSPLLNTTFPHAPLPSLHRAGCLAIYYQWAKTHDHPLSDRARQLWRQHRMRQAVYRREMADLADTLADIDYVVLKGEPLAKMLFDDAKLRYASDIDILVTPEAIDDTLERLVAEGWHTLPDSSFDAWCNNQRMLQHDDRPSALEAHWRIAYPDVPAPDARTCLRHRTTVELSDGVRLPTLDVEWTLVQLCYNFHHDQGSLKGLIDITAWFETFGDSADLTVPLHTLQRHGAAGLLYWPLETLRRLGVDLNPAATQLHRQSKPDANSPTALTLPLLAESTTRAIHDTFIAPTDPTALDDLIADHHALRTLHNCLQRAATNLAFTDWHRHPTRLLNPILLARHTPGRTLAKLLNLPDHPA